MTKTLELSESILEKELDVLLEGDHARLLAIWLQGEEDKAKVTQTLLNSGFQFDRLRRILRQLYREAQHKSEDITSENWKDALPYHMGYKKALRDVYRLIPKTTQE